MCGVILLLCIVIAAAGKGSRLLQYRFYFYIFKTRGEHFSLFDFIKSKVGLCLLASGLIFKKRQRKKKEGDSLYPAAALNCRRVSERGSESGSAERIKQNIFSYIYVLRWVFTGSFACKTLLPLCWQTSEHPGTHCQRTVRKLIEPLLSAVVEAACKNLVIYSLW